MKDLFYCEADETLFWVAGYTRDNNTAFITEKLEDLKSNGEKFAEVAGTRLEAVMTKTVTRSRKYLHMRVFYALLESQKVPESAFRLGTNWKSMEEWITY